MRYSWGPVRLEGIEDGEQMKELKELPAFHPPCVSLEERTQGIMGAGIDYSPSGHCLECIKNFGICCNCQAAEKVEEIAKGALP